MAKMKIKKSVLDRFKITKKGKVLHARSFSSHLKSSKSKSQKRRLKKINLLEGKIKTKIKKILGVKK